LTNKENTERGATVIQFSPKQTKRSRRRPGGTAGLVTAGNLALAPEAQAAPAQKPIPFATPSRWYGEKHNSIGFRLWDIVYLFALARQVLKAHEAIGWGARYFSGMLSEEHGRSVLGALAPGQEDDPTVDEIPEQIREAFRRAICQGAGRLLGRTHLQAEKISEEDANQLQLMLEEMYDERRWMMPAVPFTLHRLLRRAGLISI
jgi:hypothetical protein